uniref:DUF6824 domain-containing protein n=1 Tax=Corethron hystrix TaxID=216773 RepID=A0A7S1FUC5_9STRA|mmetsp:Transcript_29353/g.67413  ORF Transcript_29353/g.67413 Transcript_29353/m.67413 type:complete len:426 (+) Transcript_29353:197-1474(+)
MTPKTLGAIGSPAVSKGIKEPGPNDVLSGRGSRSNHHEGNIRFRDLVSKWRPKYIASEKNDKPAISLLVVAQIRSLDPPGRFLTLDKKNRLWNDIGNKRAHEKVSQAMRDGPSRHVVRVDPHLQALVRSTLREKMSQTKQQNNGASPHNFPLLNRPALQKKLVQTKQQGKGTSRKMQPSLSLVVANPASNATQYEQTFRKGGPVDSPSLLSPSNSPKEESDLKMHENLSTKKRKRPELLSMSSSKKDYRNLVNNSLVAGDCGLRKSPTSLPPGPLPTIQSARDARNEGGAEGTHGPKAASPHLWSSDEFAAASHLMNFRGTLLLKNSRAAGILPSAVRSVPLPQPAATPATAALPISSVPTSAAPLSVAGVPLPPRGPQTPPVPPKEARLAACQDIVSTVGHSVSTEATGGRGFLPLLTKMLDAS